MAICVSGVCRLNADLHEESAHRMLEGGDRTVGIGEGGLEMGKDLRRRRSARRFGRQLGRRAPSRQCRADFALAEVEAFPDALPGPLTSPAVSDATACSGNAAGDGTLQESAQCVGGQAQPPDLVRDPDAEGATAATPPIAVAAKDPPSADGLALGVALVVAAQKAVAIQRANCLAMRAPRLLELFSNRAPFRVAAEKPRFHVRPVPRENH
jgi:hypothetical protein